MKKAIAKKQNPKLKNKLDSLENIITGIGTSKDKRTSTNFVTRYLLKQQIDSLYSSSDVAATIVDKIPEEMTREGFKVKADGEDFTEYFQEYFERYELDEKIEQCLKWQRLYGGAGLLIGVGDGKKSDMPIDINTIQKIDYWVPFNRFNLRYTDTTSIEKYVDQPNYGRPKYYSIFNTDAVIQGEQMGSTVKIDQSRVFQFYGVPVRKEDWSLVDYWGDSILSRIHNIIRDYTACYEQMAVLFEDFNQMIIKMKDLPSLIAQGKRELVQQRLLLMEQTISIMNGVIISEGEEIEIKSRPVAGLADLIDRQTRRLVAASGIPQKILLGENTTGLNNNDEQVIRQWYDTIKSMQESRYRPKLKQILRIIFASKDGPTKGRIPEKIIIEFNPLWQQTQKEILETRKIQADIDNIYLEKGVLDAEEVAQSRFGDEGFSYETELDSTVRRSIEAPDLPDDETVSGNSGEE